jgi:glycosyltransferase involved in cell wall biosynthesis
MPEIRLLHLFKSFNIGGVEKSTIRYSNQLSNNIEFVGLFARKGTYDHTNIVSEKLTQFFAPFNMRLTIFSFVFYVCKILSILRRYHITTLNYHQRIYIPVIWCVKLFFPSVNIVYTAHTCFHDVINHFIIANTIIAVSGAVKRDLPTRYQSKIVQITHGIDPQPVILRFKHDYRVGYVGRFDKNKGIITLIDALNVLRNRNIAYTLTLRGEGPFEKEIIHYLKNSPLDSHAIILPPEIDDTKIFNGIDLIVLPSLSLEGFGLVLIEAMNAGIPVVGSDITGINEIIIDRYNGRIVPPGDSLALANAIQSIAEDNVEREKYITNGYLEVADKYLIGNYLLNYSRALTRRRTL